MLSLPLPAKIWDVLRQWTDEGKSGQITLEFRGGRLVAFRPNEHIRLDASYHPQVSADLDTKTTAR